MQEEGVNVIFGVEGLKIHSKLLYIKTTKGDLACVGTGNFHEGNARVYTDYLMMTARQGIVSEVAKVFDFIDRPFSPMRFKELLVSPNSMKTRILRLFDTEIKNAQMGKPAWVKIKINHITDQDVVNKMYAASRAGVGDGRTAAAAEREPPQSAERRLLRHPGVARAVPARFARVEIPRCA